MNIALVVVVVVTSALSRDAADEEAVSDARAITRVLGRSVAQPAIPEGLVTGDAAAIDRLDRTALDRLLVDDVRRIKVWAADGTILYSDRTELIGAVYPLGDDELGAGADEVGGAELIEKVAGGYTAFDSAVSTPELMGQVGRLGKVLGPRGLMPNPKTGTVTPDVAKAVTDIKGGKIEFRVDKHSNVHFVIGKAGFSSEQLSENLNAALEEVIRLKPSSSKGRYVSKGTLSTTFGPGIPLDVNAL